MITHDVTGGVNPSIVRSFLCKSGRATNWAGGRLAGRGLEGSNHPDIFKANNHL